jgi:hypothetical protein
VRTEVPLLALAKRAARAKVHNERLVIEECAWPKAFRRQFKTATDKDAQTR